MYGKGYRIGDFDLPEAMAEWRRLWEANHRREVERQAAFSRTMTEIKALPCSLDRTLDTILVLPMTLHPKGLE